jgi:hypothetical protein
MLWRKGSKPSFARPNNKVWVLVNLLHNVVVSLSPPTLPIFEEIGSPSNDVQPNHSRVPHFSPHRIFGYIDYKRRLVFLSSLMSRGKFSIVFLSKYKTKNLVHMLLLLFEFSPSILDLDVGHALQLSKIPSIFIKRNVPRSFLSSCLFPRQRSHYLCFCFFLYGWFESLSHLKPSFCARLSSSFC